MHRKTHLIKIVLAVSLALAIPSNTTAATETINACGSSANPLTIPAAQTVNITIEGAGGGGGIDGAGGAGGLIELQYQASAGETLDLYAGCGGGGAGDGTGGAGYVSGDPGEEAADTGGGGGSSAVLGGNDNRIASAGGGGGGGDEGGFLDGGASGGAGGGNGNTGGAGGTADSSNGGDGSSAIEQGTAENQQTGGGGAGGGTDTAGSDGQVTVEYNIPPTVRSNATYNRTGGKLVEKSEFIDSDKLAIRSNITDPDSNIAEASVTIRDPTGSLRLDNGSMTELRSVNIDGDSGSLFERNHTFSDIYVGEWSFTVWTSDEEDFWNKSSGTFQMIDITPPETRNTFQNRTLMTVHDTALLEAEGFDNWILSHAMLATNETGTWENKTGSYGSPIQYNTKQAWETSSFEWKNNSLTGNRSVHWHIWFNDTSGNAQRTQTNSFRVRENYNFPRELNQQILYSDNLLRDYSVNRSFNQNISIEDIPDRFFKLDRKDETSINVSENTTRNQTIKPEHRENLSTKDLNPRLAEGSRSFITGASFTDPGTRINDVSRIFSQSITIDEKALSFYKGFRDQLETVSYQDITYRSQNLARNSPLTVTYTPESFRAGIVQRVLFESYTGEETTTRAFTGNRVFNSAFSLQEDTGRTAFNLRAFTQTITVSTAAERGFFGARTVIETFTGSETQTRSAVNLREFSQEFGFKDERLTSSVLARSFRQGLNIEPIAERTVFNYRSVADSLTAEENTVRQVSAGRTVSDSMGLNSEFVTDSILRRTFETIYRPDPEPGRGFTGSRITTQAVMIEPQSFRNILSYRLDSFTTEFGDTTSQSSLLGRVREIGIVQASEFDRSNTVSRVFSQSFEPSLQPLRNIDVRRFVADSIISTDSQSRAENIRREIVTQTALGTLTPRSVINTRTFDQTVNYENMLTRSFTGSRLFNSEIVTGENTDRNILSERVNTDTFTGSEDVSRAVLNLRQAPLNLVTENAVSRSATMSREFLQSTEVETEAVRQVLGYRAVSETLTLEEEVTLQSLLERTNTATLGYTEFRDRGSTLSRVQDASFSFTTPTSRSLNGARLFTSTFEAESEESSAGDYIREFVSRTAFTADPQRETFGRRQISSSIETGIEATRLSQNLRNVFSEILVEERTLEGDILVRIFSQDITTESALPRTTDLGRLVQENIEGQSQELTFSELGRAVENSVSAGFLTERALLASRTETTSIGYQGITRRASDVLRDRFLEIATGEDTSRTVFGAREVFETVSGNTNAERNILGQRTNILSITGQSTEARSLDGAREIAESFIQISSLDRQTLTDRILESGISTTETQNRNVFQNRAVNSRISVAENSFPALKLHRIVSDSVNTDSRLTVSSILARSFSQTLTTENRFKTTSVLSRTTATGISTSVGSDAFSQLFRIESFTTGFDQQILTSSFLERVNTDSISLTGEFSQTSTLNRAFNQGIGSETGVLRSVLVQRIRNTEITGETDREVSSNLGRAFSQTFLGETSIDRSSSTSRTVIDTASITSNFYRSSIQQRINNLQVSGSDSVVALPNFRRVLSQTVQQSAEFDPESSVVRNIETGLTAGTSSSLFFELGRTNALTVEGSDNLVTSSVLGRVMTEQIDVSRERQVESFVVRTVSDQVSITPTIGKFSTFNKMVAEDIFYIEETINDDFSTRVVKLVVGAGSAESREISGNRIVQETSGITGSFTTSSSISRLFSQSLTLDQATVRNIFSDRLQAELFETGTAENRLTGLGRDQLEVFSTDQRETVSTALGRSVTDIFLADDSRETGVSVSRLTQQTVAAGVENTVLSQLGRTEGFTAGFTSGTVSGSALNRVIAQSLPISETIDREAISERIVTEVTEVTGPGSRSILNLRIEDTSVNTDITRETSSVLGRAFAQAFTGRVTESRTTGSNRLVSENLDAQTENLQSLIQQRVTDLNTGYTDTITVTPNFKRVFEQVFRQETDIETNSIISRALGIELGAETVSARTTGIERLTSTSLITGDFVSSSSVLDRVNTETIQADNIPTTSSILARTVSQQTGITPEIADYITFTRVFNEDIDSTFKVVFDDTTDRVINLVIQSSTSENRQQGIRWLLEETTGLTDEQELSSNLGRILNSYIQGGSETERGVLQTREIISSFNLGSENSITGSFSRTTNEVFEGISQLNTASNLERNLQESIETENQVSKFSALARFTRQRITSDLSFQGSTSLERVLITDTQVSENIYSISGLSREQDLTLDTSNSITGSLLLERGLETGIKASENLVRQTLMPRSIQEALDISQSMDRELNNLRQISETLMAAESRDRSLISGRAISSSLGLNTAQDRELIQLRDLSTGIIRTGSVLTQSDLARNIEEAINLQTEFTGESFLSRVLKTGIESSIGEDRQFIGEITQEDNLVARATVSSQTLNLREVNQEIRQTFQQDRTSYLSGRAVEQILRIQGVPERQTSSIRAVSETTEFRSATSRILTAVRLTSFTTGFNNQIVSESTLNRVLGTELEAGIANSRVADTQRLLRQTFIAEDTNSESLLLGRFVSAETGIDTGIETDSLLGRVTETEIKPQDTVETASSLGRQITQNIIFNSDQTRIVTFYNQITETIAPQTDEESASELQRITLLETQTGTGIETTSLLQRAVLTGISTGLEETVVQSVSRTLGETFNFDDTSSLSSSLQRAFSQGITGETDLETGSVLERAFQLSTGVRSEQDRSVEIGRNRITGLAYSDTIIGSKAISTVITESLATETSQDRYISAGRAVTATLGFQDVASTDFVIPEVVVETGIGFDTDRQRTVSVFRQVSENFGFEWFFERFLPSSDDDSTDETDDSTDDGSDSGGGSSGGGGFTGGGGFEGGGTTDPIDEVTESPKLSFVGDKVTVKLAPGESSTAQVELENNGNAEAETGLEIIRFNSETVDAVNLQSNDYVIEEGSSVNPTMDIRVPEYLSDENLSSRVLERSLQASTEESQASIPVNILVESSDEELLDVRLDLPENEITEQEKAGYSFEIFNLGQSGRVDIELFTTVTNSTGDVVHEEKEEIAVQTSASVSRNLDAELPPGQYRVEVEAVYADKDASSFSTLTVEETEDNTMENVAVALGIIVLMAGSALLAIFGYKRRTVDYNELIQQNISDIKDYAQDHEIDFQKLLKEEETHKDRKTLEKWAARKAGMDASRYDSGSKEDSGSGESSKTKPSSSKEPDTGSTSSGRPVVEVTGGSSKDTDKSEEKKESEDTEEQEDKKETGKEEKTTETEEADQEEEPEDEEAEESESEESKEEEPESESEEPEDEETDSEVEEQEEIESEDSIEEDLEKEKRAKEKMQKLQDKLNKIENINEDLEDSIDEE